MKKSSLGLAFKLAALVEEYSEQEVRTALDLLERHGHDEFLIRRATHVLLSNSPVARSPIKVKDKTPDSTSKAVLKLKEIDSEKFRVLAEFDALVRRGQMLPTGDELKRFGERLSKEFRTKKSRAENINTVMAALSVKSIADIEQEVAYAASLGVSGDTDEYQRLAKFLITGVPDA